MIIFLLLLLIIAVGLIFSLTLNPVFMVVFIAIILAILMLLHPRIIISSHLLEWVLLLLIVLKPIVDAGWNIHIGGTKLLHIYSASVYLYALFLILLRKSIVRSFNFYPFVLIMGLYYLTLSIFYFLSTGNVIKTVEYLMRMTYGIPFFFLFGKLLNMNDLLKKFLTLTVWIIVPVAISGLYFLISKDPAGFQITGGEEKFWRLKTFYHDASVFGLKMVPLLIGSIYLYYEKSGRIRNLYLLFSILAILLMFYTYTRAFWFFLFTVLILWSVWRKNVTVPLLAAIIIIFNWNHVVERILYSGFTLESPYGFGGRVGIWKFSLNAFMSSPVFSKFFGLFVSGMAITGGFLHNQYLQWLMDGGIVGVVINIIVYGTFFVYALARFRNGDKRAILPIYYLTLLLVTGFTAAYLNVPNIQVYLWSFLGVITYSPLKLAHGSKGSKEGNSHGLREYYHQSDINREEG